VKKKKKKRSQLKRVSAIRGRGFLLIPKTANSITVVEAMRNHQKKKRLNSYT
jgi:hypothetical protein